MAVFVVQWLGPAFLVKKYSCMQMKYGIECLQARFRKYNLTKLTLSSKKWEKNTANAFPNKSHGYTRLGHRFCGIVGSPASTERANYSKGDRTRPHSWVDPEQTSSDFAGLNFYCTGLECFNHGGVTPGTSRKPAVKHDRDGLPEPKFPWFVGSGGVTGVTLWYFHTLLW